MGPDNLEARMRAMSARLAGATAHQAIVQQLNLLLHSRRPFLPAAKVLGSLLADAGLFHEAQELYRELAEHFPDEPTGLVGLAQLAMQQREWRDALTCWDEVTARFPDRPAASWLGGRATTLMELRRFDDAENIFRALTQD